MDETQSLLQRFLFGSSVVGVRLLIELCDVLHHLTTQKGGKKLGKKNYLNYRLERQVVPVCVLYLVLVGETPNPSSHLHREDEKQEEEELRKQNMNMINSAHISTLNMFLFYFCHFTNPHLSYQ